MEGRELQFNNTPFTTTEIRKLDCQFGNHYYKEHQGASSHTRPQGTRKIGCRAHITVRTTTLFPEFQLSEVESTEFGARKLKQRKQELLASLQEALSQRKSLQTCTKVRLISTNNFVYKYQSF